MIKDYSGRFVTLKEIPDQVRNDGSSIILFLGKYNRLKMIDYNNSTLYFVTVTTKGRVCLFGTIDEGQMHLNEMGMIVNNCWLDIPENFPDVVMDVFVVMPNHVHGIIMVNNSQKKTKGAKKSIHKPEKGLLEAVIGQFSYKSTMEIVTMSRREKTDEWRWSIWNDNYYTRIIESEHYLNILRWYIIQNPYRWDVDRENPYRNIQKRRDMP